MRLRGQFFVATAGLFVAFGFAPASANAGPFGTGDFTLNVPAPDYGRPPKPGEHLGDYLLAEKLPSQLVLRSSISWGPTWDRPWVPKLGELPPKPGECLGEYALASELPQRPQ